MFPSVLIDEMKNSLDDFCFHSLVFRIESTHEMEKWDEEFIVLS